MKRLAAAALAAFALPLAAQTVSYDCRGTVRTENLFDGGVVTQEERRWRIVANPEAGYVKRDPELATGCVQPTVEVCGCEQSSDTIACRSLGISSGGVELATDFRIDRKDNRMKLTGRRYDPRSGTVIETNGELECRAGP